MLGKGNRMDSMDGWAGPEMGDSIDERHGKGGQRKEYKRDS